jgi:alpha-tubulin suppressor-like RCC1 family protein
MDLYLAFDREYTTPGAQAVACSAGNQHTCAIANQGGLLCWGSNIDGQLGIGSRIDSGPQTVGQAGAALLVGRRNR